MAEGRSRIWIWLLVGGGLFALFVVGVFTLVYLSFGGQNNEEAFSGFGPKIGVVDLDGVIFSPKQIVPQLKKFADDDSIKAIIIHVNSPGGGVAASEEIYREVKRIRDEKKKRIEWVNYGELLRWAKLNPITMKAGEFKDTGSPTREMTPAEREYMQGLIDNMHTQFIRAVADGRHASEADIRAIANGKVWTGEQAADLKLVDQITDFEGAVKDTARAVNISGEPTLVYPPKDKRSGLDLLFGDVSDYLPTREKLLEQQVGFYYLWK
jgi:protease-4